MRKFNFDEFMWLIILVLMALGFSYLIQTGKIEFYIGKKMIKYIYISIVMILIIAVFQIRNIFTPKSSMSIKIKYLPIIFALIVGVVSVKSQDSFRHRQLNNVLINEYNEDNEDVLDDKTYEKDKYKDSSKDKVAKEMDNMIIKIDDDNLNILEDIQKDPDKYIGKNIEFYGFVCRESYLKNNQFVIGRVIMTCCAADSKIVGILAENEGASQLNENEWVTIKGSLSYTTINDDDGVSHRVPVIIADNLIKSADENVNVKGKGK